MKYNAIRSEGGLIPYDLLEQIANEQVPGQKSVDFGLPKGRRLSDEIQRVWSDAQDLWDILNRRRENLPEKDAYGTTLTRERWILPLLSDPQTFGYDLKLQPSAISVNGASFSISHLAGDSQDAPPVHIEGFKLELDHRSPKLRTSPRAMMQEFLNRSEAHLWGIVTNGLRFLLLRDSARTARPTYLEFDLETILEGNHFHEFALFYRLCHRSRLPGPGEDSSQCLLEQYYQLSIEQGGRVRERLRDGVEEALKILGTGFLRHPANEELRAKFVAQEPNCAGYHRQLLRLIYRLLFLMVAEERHLIVSTSSDAERLQRIYDDSYSISRLRERAEGIVEESTFSDLWIGLQKTFSLFSDTQDQNSLGIPPLNGELFGSRAIPDLEGTQLHNHVLLQAVRRLSLFREDKVLHRINYSALDVEELGSVYESLLDFRPIVVNEAQGPEFELHVGTERKTTGSYYTRPELVRELIQSALVPVIEDRLAEAEKESKGKSETEIKAAKEKAILSISVCDPACGSGHFLLESARRLGRELARIRTDQDEPGPEDFHLAMREAISHCIYGVDLNPLAVDLCKLALWLEGHWMGKPLSFLDHRIKCGNSLIGVLDPASLENGIPDEAFNPVTGDDKKVASAFKKRNRNERAAPSLRQQRFGFEPSMKGHLSEYVSLAQQVAAMVDDRPADVKRKAGSYEESRANAHWYRDSLAASAWTGSFFVPLQKHNDPSVPTHETFLEFLQGRLLQALFIPVTQAISAELRFFHWFLEFPDVFAFGGFDVVLGNPPWERIKLQEEEHWAYDPYISSAPTKAERARRIEEYRESDDPEKQKNVMRFDSAKHAAEATSKFVRESGRFPLSAVGDINTYALFAEMAKHLLNTQGRAGIIVPTGIATDDTNKQFFATLNQQRSLASLYDFENREAIFPGVDRRYKFSLLSMSAIPQNKADFAFFLSRIEHLRDPRRRFQLSPEDFALLNPNTRTCPVFRTLSDVELTKKIYSRVPILVNETTGENPWGIKFITMFHMSNDSHLFKTKPGPGLLPLYEGKMVQAYDHRAASVITNVQNLKRPGQPVPTSPQQHCDRSSEPKPQYWIPEPTVVQALPPGLKRHWFIGFKSVTSPTNERTFITTVLPWSGVSNSMPLILSAIEDAKVVACLLANLNSLVFDYVARQKVGGVNLNFFIINQLPAFPPKTYKAEDVVFVSSRVLELVYTSEAMRDFAEEMGFDGEPFLWDDARRSTLVVELDAFFAHLYGMTRQELSYILDPKEVYGEDYPSETFRGLKEQEERAFGEYRTRRIVLAAYDELAKSDRFAEEKRESVIEAPKGRSMVSIS